jgi:hypothetical protein
MPICRVVSEGVENGNGDDHYTDNAICRYAKCFSRGVENRRSVDNSDMPICRYASIAGSVSGVEKNGRSVD